MYWRLRSFYEECAQSRKDELHITEEFLDFGFRDPAHSVTSGVLINKLNSQCLDAISLIIISSNAVETYVKSDAHGWLGRSALS